MKEKGQVDNDQDHTKLNCPYTCFRPLFGVVILVLLIGSIHMFLYVSYIYTQTPDCSQCTDPDDKLCNMYCNVYVDDFIYKDPDNRNQLIAYLSIVMFVRCLAFTAGFIGVFLMNVYLMITYLILYFGLLIAFFLDWIWISIEGKSTHEFVFGQTTMTTVIWSITYALEIPMFLIGLVLAHKYIMIKFYHHNKH